MHQDAIREVRKRLRTAIQDAWRLDSYLDGLERKQLAGSPEAVEAYEVRYQAEVAQFSHAVEQVARHLEQVRRQLPTLPGTTAAQPEPEPITAEMVCRKMEDLVQLLQTLIPYLQALQTTPESVEGRSVPGWYSDMLYEDVQWAIRSLNRWYGRILGGGFMDESLA